MANNKNITFDQLEASMTKVKAEIDKKANTNHGTHVPTTGTANNATYLRNDNQWHKIVPSDIGAASSSHTHSYIPLGGSSSITGNLEFSNSGTTTRGIIGAVGDNDFWRIVGGATASNAGYLEIATADDANEPIYVRQYGSGKFGTLTRTATLLDGSGNTSFPGTVTAPTFSGTLNGKASKADRLTTARAIALSGDVTGSANFDGSANITIDANNRQCCVGQTSDTTTNPYYKFASIQITSIYDDREIVFKVSTGYGNNTASGILRAHVRTNGSVIMESADLYWEYADSGIDTSKFVMAYSTTANPTIELWVKVDVGYMMYHFTVLQEHDRCDAHPRWTLYNTYAAGSASAITSGYTQLVSSCLKLNNEAAKATTLTTARTINGTSFNGSANITTANWGTARTLTIGNSGKSVNGSGNVSWSLSEIGAAPSSHGHNFMYVKGTNTIGSVNDDTTSNWGAQGNSVHWYAGVEGLLHDQPSSWGYLLNIGQNSEVHQIWMTQASGDLLHRGGNGSGWSGSWKTILDTSNYSNHVASKSHTHTNLVTKTVSNSTLTLGTELYQYAAITSNTTIKLPSVSAFTEIHLFFNWPANVSVTMPSGVKWQQGVMYGPGHVHEFVFTYVNNIGWLGGCVVYG